MKYTYKITDLVIDTPENSYIRIEYMSEGKQTIPFQTYVPNLRPGFEQEDIESFVKSTAISAISTWNVQEIESNQKEAYAQILNSIDPTNISINSEVEVESTEPTPDPNAIINELKNRRNMLLFETDYVVASDSPAPTQEMLEYRQALRDITKQDGWPIDVIWPERPYIPSQEELDQDVNYFRSTSKVTMRQARLALSRQGLLGQVQAGIDALPEESQIEWEYAGSVERNSPLVQSLGAALGLTEEQLDDLFKLAETL